MSTTTLARTVQGPVRPLTRIPRRISATPTRNSRPSRKQRREDRRIVAAQTQAQAASEVEYPRVMDLHIRSTALWPRAHR
jgi:hypothetical protein